MGAHVCSPPVFSQQSPHHWYNMVVRKLKDMGIVTSAHNPCLFTGVIRDPNTTIPSSTPHASINIGLYVNNFVFYLTSLAEESLFQRKFQKLLKVDFMGDVDYFLGTILPGIDIMTVTSTSISANRHSLNLVAIVLELTSSTPSPT